MLKRLITRLLYEMFAKRLPSFAPGGTRLRVGLASIFLESVDPTAVIREGVRFTWYVNLAEGAGVGPRSTFLGCERVMIGRDVIMGPECLFITGDHPVPTDGKPFKEQPARHSRIVIEEDVFLGARVTILPGVTIGRGAAVGAGAVVAKDVPPGTTVVGNPARVVATREAEPR